MIIFGNGFIGHRIQQSFGCDQSTTHGLTVERAMDEIGAAHANVVINAIASTGRSNCDECEDNKTATLEANVLVPVILAEACYRLGKKLVHISSGCIYKYDYSYDLPLSESRVPDFFDLFYSRTKVYAEYALRPYPNILTVRLRTPLDDRPHPRNLLTKLLGFSRVIDTPNSVTYLPDMLPALEHLIGIDAKGVYNLVCAGALYYPELLKTYELASGRKLEYVTIRPQYLGLTRTNILLSTDKLSATGFAVRDIRDVLPGCVAEYLRRSNA